MYPKRAGITSFLNEYHPVSRDVCAFLQQRPRSQALWEEVRRLRLTDGENGIDLCELISLEIEVFFHSRYISIGEIAPIKLDTLISRRTMYQ
jgi:hypothetical protein